MAIDLTKKVAGVPVVYLGLGAAAVLGVVAWKMKPASTGESAPVQGAPDAATDTPTDPYAGFETNGTVVVSPTTPPPPPEPDRPDTNDEWVRSGAEWLVAEKNVSGTAAYTALTKYIDGKSRSTTEAQWIEWVIKEKGFPPDPFIDAPIPIVPSSPGTTIPPGPNPGPTPTTNPNVVTGMQIVSKGYNSLTMVWKPVTGAYSYAVYQAGKGKVGTTTVPGFTVTGLSRGTTYRFQVAAIMRSTMTQAQASAYFSGTTAK